MLDRPVTPSPLTTSIQSGTDSTTSRITNVAVPSSSPVAVSGASRTPSASIAPAIHIATTTEPPAMNAVAMPVPMITNNRNQVAAPSNTQSGPISLPMIYLLFFVQV